MVGRSLGVPWFILGSSLVFNPRGIGKVQGKENLNKSTFFGKVPEYHSGAINKEKHLQGRCCDQWAQKCLGSRDMLNHASGTSELLFVLCIALTPQSGDSSGAILGVRSVALLHVIDSGKKGKHKEKARKWQRHGKENAKNKERKRREKRAKK